MVAVAVGSRLYAKVIDLDDLPPTLMDEMEQFFINYNRMRAVRSSRSRGAARQTDRDFLVEYRVIRHVSD
jgi:inorganic pyrophosphatase